MAINLSTKQFALPGLLKAGDTSSTGDPTTHITVSSSYSGGDQYLDYSPASILIRSAIFVPFTVTLDATLSGVTYDYFVTECSAGSLNSYSVLRQTGDFSITSTTDPGSATMQLCFDGYRPFIFNYIIPGSP